MITRLTESEKDRFMVRMISGYVFGLTCLLGAAVASPFFGFHVFGIFGALVYLFVILIVSLPLLVFLTFLGLRYPGLILRHPLWCSVGGVIAAFVYSLIFSHRDGIGPVEIASLIVSIPAATFFTASMMLSPFRHSTA